MRLFNRARAGQSATASARLIQNNIAIRRESDDDKPRDTSPRLAEKDESTDSDSSRETDDDAEAQRALHEADCFNALIAPPRHDSRSRTRRDIDPSQTNRREAGSSRGPRTSLMGEQTSALKALFPANV